MWSIFAPPLTDHTDGNVFGGFGAEWVGEASPFTVQTPTMQRIAFKAKKLGIMCRVSSELSEDSPMFSASLTAAMARAASFFLDKVFLRGDGTAEPQGILNSPSLVSVAKEIGQSAATILTENIVSIWARMLPGSVRNAVWLAHPSTLPQLLTLSLSVGTGGSVVDHLVRGAEGAMTLLGRPLLLTEHCSPVGTVGDIVLADLSFYAVAMRTDVRIDVSTAPHFMFDELAVRLKIRLDAKSLTSAATTPAQGTDTLSPFVAIETRA